MSMLAERVDGVSGVDTHRDTLTAAAPSAVGGLLGQLAVAADAAGYQHLLDFAGAQIPGRRWFAVEGAGSYGAGLTRLLVDHGEWVVEVDRPKRPARRGGKSDALDAVRAAREALAQERLAVLHRRGDRGGVAGAAGHPPGCGDRADLRHQPAQGADRWGARGSAGRAAQPLHQRPSRLLRGAARAASQVLGAPYDGPSAALHRPAGPAACR
jgi:hypothetical protein